MDTSSSHNEQELPSQRLNRLLTNPQSRYLVLQGLVSIILSYELVFNSGVVISGATSHGLVAALWLSLTGLALLPNAVLAATWFGPALVLVDTVVVTLVIYLSGNAQSELYIAYFALMLVAASVQRLSHVMGLSLLLSLGYAAVLYGGVIESETAVTGQLLGIPVLLVMAVFYGVALEVTAVTQEQNTTLLKDVESLKKTEDELRNRKMQLEERIQGLREQLSRTQADLRDGQTLRAGLERQLHEAQKMEAVGRVAAGIASEFGSLFSVIGKQTGIMLSRLQPSDPLRASADELFRAGEQAATLTAQLIALKLDERQVHDVVPVHRIVLDMYPLIRSLLPSTIELTMHATEQGAYAEVDREGLENVLFQLVINARDAMAEGGRLTIDVTTVNESSVPRRVSSEEFKGSHVMIRITDSGTGMNLDTQSHMFEPFFSTKETNIGLGLTAVYGIVKQNGGRLDVESQPGHGTTVRVLFPAAPASERQGCVPDPLLAKGNETVLLVDGDELHRKLARATLQRHRYRVLEAASSVEALMMIQQYKGVVHLTVSPLVMPEMGGRELARRLLTQHPMMKALFVSSYDDETIHHHRINQRCIIQHPYRRVGLVEKVREVLDAA